MFTRIACLLAVFPLLAADPQDDKDKAPAELQGAWKLLSVEADEGNLPESRPVLVIKGDRLFYGGEAIARISADPATKPKVLDLRFTKPDRVYEGVYAVENDSLKICLNGHSDGVKERPQAFAIKDRPAFRLLVLERAKAEDPKAGTGFVGLMLSIDKENDTVVVTDTLEGSPAKKAGFAKDDVVLQVSGVAVTDLRSTVDAVRRTRPSSDLTIRVRRDGKERDVTVRVGLLPFRFVAGLD